MASACTSPPPDAEAILRSWYGSASVSKSWAMPCRSSTSQSSTLRPSAARARASAAATVVFPVPPLPVTMWSLTADDCWGLTLASLTTRRPGYSGGRRFS